MARSSNVTALREALKKVYGKEGYDKFMIFADRRASDYRVKVMWCTTRQDEVVKAMEGIPVTYTIGRSDFPRRYEWTAFIVPFGKEA